MCTALCGPPATGHGGATATMNKHAIVITSDNAIEITK